jgi:hypothetical protein
MQQSASRFLLTAVQFSATQNPKSVLEGLLVPIIKTYDNKPVLGALQLEVLSRFIENMPMEYVYQYFQAIATDNSQDDSIVWNEDLSSLLRTIINQMLSPKKGSVVQTITNQELSSLLLKLDECASKFTASSKFASLVFTIITKLPPTQIAPQADILQSIIESNTTFMQKSAMNALKKIK